jgi:uncharacterized protein
MMLLERLQPSIRLDNLRSTGARFDRSEYLTLHLDALVRIPKSLRIILVRAIQVILISCAFIFAISVYANKIEPNWIEVTNIDVKLPQLDREFFGYRIVQISDLHAGDGSNRAQLERVIAIANEQKPDLVVLTGDHVSRKPRQHVELLNLLSKLQPRDRTIAILGNHDVYNDPEPIRQALKQAGVILLENNFDTIERNRATLHIAGVGDVFAGLDRIDEIMAKLPSTGAAIILAHEPDFADTSAATGRFGLQLSGHSHGGQVRVPFYRGFRPTLARKYTMGRYQVGNMVQYTNRGIGTIKIRARFNCRPEISVFNLVSSSQS